jgi:ABC-type phosphate transport system substrate-binding protein
VNIIKNSIALLALSLSISACTPPMPPEFQAQLAERYVTCVSGEIAISTVPELAEVTQAWVDGLSENCSDLSATIIGAVDETEVPLDDAEVPLDDTETAVDDTEIPVEETETPVDDTETPADVFITAAGATPSCNVAASSPVGIDAVAIVVSVAGLDGVVFSPALLHRALSGGMASWADPELQELNPEIQLIDIPMVLRAPTRPQDIASLNDWMNRLDPVGWPGSPSGLVADAVFNAEAVVEELATEGTISVVPASLVTNNSLETVSIQISPELETLYLNVETVISAGTQMVATTSGSVVTAKIDAALPPLPAAGNDFTSLPWQALNQFTITVCAGANEMAGRAFARYALRLESQGVMTSYGFTEMPEQIRLAGLAGVSQGLPEPTIPPSGAPEEVLEEVPADDPTEVPSEEPLEEETDMTSPEPTP